MATTFLVLSDTHDDAFPDPASVPKVDVVLHCGDLTMIGGLSNYKKAIANINALDAEVKLVIAGNHDVSLDPKWWEANLDVDDDDPQEPAKALELFAAERTNGLYFLEEGTHTFTLSENRTFTVYASPYTPEFNGYAFAYQPGEDRFGPGAKEPIPPGVDIVMTHGPPLLPSHQYQLDTNRDGMHCGCPMLYAAIRRVKPRIHCFGHIHEGYGVQGVSWGPVTDVVEELVSRDPGKAVVVEGSEDRGRTVLINAAIMNHGEEANNKPWVVSLDLGGEA
ncbi:Metallo-dependent phosphatase-like protein [Cercophora newfieldiana]|uniref:Metallo-dependent phosphatase-like protein n=1 Tax=Cercophora newfieldiana TaxID=92897 RepID=A0AA39YSW0_9PEZI|nr:Metallo-dependent phosphatase-like protein [Cercophora newfieldiana]